MKKTFLFLFSFVAITLFAQKLPVEQFKSMKARCIGPGGMSGRVTAIDVVSTNQNDIYIGTASGGVWRSQSGGINWEPLFDKMPTQSIGSLAINQRNPAEIWVGTGEGNPRNSHNSGEGIFKSIDGGKTWKCMGLQGTKTIHRIVINKDNPDVIFAAALGNAWGKSEERGIFKTTDGGKNWRKILYVNDITGCSDLIVDPTNPNKLIATMWEFSRKPFVFQSGGKGSGLHISLDGGETWEHRTDKDGLPKGDLGRIGVAIAKSKPNVMYAIVEAKENAFYRSTDGGYKWSKMTDKGFGDRPFYYSEIYVDPKNENRVYSIFTTISRSEDGGKNWNGFAGWVIHPDHHAFWISPDNPDYIINGNDGGLNITRDGGKNWQFIENIPVGQFYHVSIDNQIPYNVYGGLQDNGSWVGPSSVWRDGGIRNFDWQEVYFGDGFDVIPRRDDNRYVFAMSQGGSLGYVDTKTGSTQYLKPVHAEGKELRFNWNAGLAQNPFSDKSIYYGSQFLHKSNDLGKSWEIISPDLTTNDTARIKWFVSGGLTPDITAAENHCTILCVAPSPLDENVIWVGTDDGNVQVTRDGGKTWTNTIANIKGLPKNAWIPQIEVNKRNAGEAFVVVNNYRQDDWKPYVFHTTDYGKTWRKIVDETKVKGHVMSFVQDLTEPNLMFCGTDGGLFVSIDGSETWTKWKSDFPSVNVMDMKIAERDADLVIGTFGRAIWILDDIRPLRELAKNKAADLQKPFKIFDAPDAYLAEFRSYEGARFDANAYFKGETKPTNAVISVWVKELLEKKESKKVDSEKAENKKVGEKESMQNREKVESGKVGESKKEEKEKDKKVKIRILSEKGDTIRTFSSEIDTFLSKITWRLNRDGVSFPSREEPKADADTPGGASVVSGKYKVYATYGSFKDSTFVNVYADPRMNISTDDMKRKDDLIKDFEKTVKSANSAFNRLKEAEKIIGLAEGQLTNAPDSVKKDIGKLATNLRDSIGKFQNEFVGEKETKGINRNDKSINSKLGTASWYMGSQEGMPQGNALLPFQQAKKEVEKILTRINAFFEKDWSAYQKKVEIAKYTLFKDWKKLE